MIVADAKFLGDCDWQGAYESFTEAVQLQPQLEPGARRLRDPVSRWTACTEAVEQARRGVESDPLAITTRQTLALMLYYARAYPDALSHAADTLALNASYPAALIVQADTLAELKRYDEALDTLKRLRAIATALPLGGGRPGCPADGYRRRWRFSSAAGGDWARWRRAVRRCRVRSACARPPRRGTHAPRGSGKPAVFQVAVAEGGSPSGFRPLGTPVRGAALADRRARLKRNTVGIR